MSEDRFIPKPPPRKATEEPIPESRPEPSSQPQRRPRPDPRPDTGHALKYLKGLLMPPSDERPERIAERALAEIFRIADNRTASQRVQSDENQLIVPLVCCTTKQAFVARFQRASIRDRWRSAETFVVSRGAGSRAPKAMTVPVEEMNWSDTLCPGCGKGCAPTLCGECRQLGCDGGISLVPPSRRMYSCSCGAVGFVEPGLKEISGAKGTRAQEAQRAVSSRSTSLVLRLPKPE